MTISAVPFALQNVPINADVVREAVSSLIPNSGGLVQPGDFAVAQTGTASMAVTVGIGRAWIPGTNVANLSGTSYSKQGMYYVLNDASVTLTIATANATNPRIDVVYIAIRDAVYSGSNNDAQLAVATGTPAASPVAPSIPSNAIALANVAVAANATQITNANVTNLATPMGLLVATYTGPAINSGTNAITLFGTLSPSAAATFNNDFCQYSGSSGQIQILKSGVYTVTATILPANSPNTTSLRIRNTTASEMVGSAVGGSYVTYETSVSATRYFAASTVLEFSMITTNNVLTGSNVTVAKIA